MFKTMLVHLSGGSDDAAVLRSAAIFAAPFAAHLDCVHIEPSMAEAARQAARLEYDDSGQAGRETFEAIVKEAKGGHARAESAFDAFCKEERVPRQDAPPAAERLTAGFRSKQGARVAALSAEARFNDLTLIRGPGDSPSDLDATDIGTLVVGSGRPVLILPAAGLQEFPRIAAIAWKDTAETARAVAAAMPVLKRAGHVVVIVANEDASEVKACLDCADGVVNHLRWHGIMAEARYIIPGGRSVADAVFDAARDANADMLVAGAYGRSRVAEYVFGGVTKRILAGQKFPVLLAH